MQIGGEKMTVKNRIARIRLSEKIARNKEYAERIGIYIVNREMDSETKRNTKTETIIILKRMI